MAREADAGSRCSGGVAPQVIIISLATPAEFFKHLRKSDLWRRRRRRWRRRKDGASLPSFAQSDSTPAGTGRPDAEDAGERNSARFKDLRQARWHLKDG
ncbi:hypothetical protein SKAU_G00028510 [Synaphobranchus kaupii]|uniref:Uncharacterized protein n=1 Tax=Synaphobranchus kaupii TaxID=118154 RepID=A0A9Q1GE77_SYNKA|nr:hypothetical protein SKAU_G00028510 [Synaphobranchus kaupii]